MCLLEVVSEFEGQVNVLLHLHSVFTAVIAPLLSPSIPQHLLTISACLSHNLFYFFLGKKLTLFDVGELLKIGPLINSGSIEFEESFQRWVRSHIANGWHTPCINLAGRISGDFHRRIPVLNDRNKTTLWSGICNKHLVH